MITRRLARPLSAFSPQSWTCPACAKTSLRQNLQPQLQRRRIHKVADLSYHKQFVDQGVPGLFSNTGYQLGWTNYQGMIIQKLNELVAGEPIENTSPKDLIIQFARDPMNASLFNHASMAHNNHFFYEALSTAPVSLNNQNYNALRESLEKTFGSIETLRITMLDTAAAMFGPGFVWLVWMRDRSTALGRGGDWRILSTYLAGTPYPEAGYRQQGVDMNNNNAASYASYHDALPIANSAGSFGSHSKMGQEEAMIPPGGPTKIMPVLCVNTWEHVYIYDYGVQGKRSYLTSWWDAVDWNLVRHRTPAEAREAQWNPMDSRRAF